jgi:hypothetical protein
MSRLIWRVRNEYGCSSTYFFPRTLRCSLSVGDLR